MSASARCPHSDLEVNVHHTGMLDSNVGSIKFSAKCKICGVRMRLDRGLLHGASSQFPTRSNDEDLGILVPVIAEDEEPTKEWGFALRRQVIG